MKFEMARESCRKPCLNGEGRSLRQCIFDVVACLGDGISIIIASIFICLRLEIARRGVAARVEDAQRLLKTFKAARLAATLRLHASSSFAHNSSSSSSSSIMQANEVPTFGR